MSNDLASVHHNDGERQRAVVTYESRWKRVPFKQAKELSELQTRMAAHKQPIFRRRTVLGLVGSVLDGASTTATGASIDSGTLLFFSTALIGDFLRILYMEFGKTFPPVVLTCDGLFCWSSLIRSLSIENARCLLGHFFDQDSHLGV